MKDKKLTWLWQDAEFQKKFCEHNFILKEEMDLELSKITVTQDSIKREELGTSQLLKEDFFTILSLCIDTYNIILIAYAKG